MAELKAFEDVVRFRKSGKVHNLIVVAVKDKGVIDGVYCQQLYAGDGKTPLNVVGSSRQVEMVQFEHDVTPDRYEVVEDFFFSLDDASLEALLQERGRRIAAKRQAEQAAADSEAAKKQAQELQGIKVKPSPAALEKAGELWREDLREVLKLDEHDHVELPPVEDTRWQPYIEKAKAFLTAEAEKAETKTQPGAAVPHGPGSGEGPGSIQ